MSVGTCRLGKEYHSDKVKEVKEVLSKFYCGTETLEIMLIIPQNTVVR